MSYGSGKTCAQDLLTGACRRRACIAFSLIELLVVMAVISVLAGLLLPALEEAIESARFIACTNQLKQLASASFLYADDHEGEGIDRIQDDGAQCYRGNLINGYLALEEKGHRKISDAPVVRCPSLEEKTIKTNSPGCQDFNGDINSSYHLVFGHGDGSTFHAGTPEREDLVAKSGFYTNEGTLAAVQNVRQIGRKINVRGSTFFQAHAASIQPLAGCTITTHWSYGYAYNHARGVPYAYLDGHGGSLSPDGLVVQRIPVNNPYYLKFRFGRMVYASP